MRIKETEVYTYDELDENAKEKAREELRDINTDYDWWDCTYDDIQTIAGYLGLDINQKPYQTMGGQTRYSPSIWFSGFYHQGSGSSYDATWDASKVKDVREWAPQDKELHRINDILTELAKENPELTARVKSDGDNWINVEVQHGETRDNVLDELTYDSPEYKAEQAKDNEREKTLTEALRDFNRWIYNQLEKEYEYKTSDEAIAETIIANEYEFTKEGERV